MSNLVVNTRNITPSLGDLIKENSFVSANSVTSASAITGFNFSNTIVRSFNSLTSVYIAKSAGGNLAAIFELKGIQKNTAGSWTLNSTFVGDNTGVVFSIDSTGQVNYTSTSIGNYVSSIIKFKALTTSQ
jgi:hypothetical protein